MKLADQDITNGSNVHRLVIENQINRKDKIIRKFMKEDNLLCAKKRFRLRTTDSNHGEKIYPNLARDLKLTGINRLWVADISYVDAPAQVGESSIITSEHF